MEVTKPLAAFAAGLSYNTIPSDVRDWARVFLLDFVGVALGAAHFFRRNGDRLMQRYLASVASRGPCTVLGYGVRTTPTLAAFANGTLAEALDFQDSNMDVLTHNGTPIIPAALALSEVLDARWSKIVAAIIAGYEVHTRLLATLQPGHWYRGFQGLGTFGTCGAAVASGKLLGLDAQAMRRALGVAGATMPVSNSDNVFKAYSVKACIPGQAARCGVSAAYLAKAGYDGVPLEGDPPSHHAPLPTLSDGPPRLERALEGLGEVWHARRVAFKPYPVGHLIVGPVEIILDILSERSLDWREVAGVDIVTYKHAVFRTGKYATPQSSYIDAHFSIPYCVAVALMDGALTPRQLWKARVRDTRVHELAARVVLTEDPAMSAAYPVKWPVELTLRLKSGETIMRRLDEVKWSPERAPSFDEIADKFRMCAEPLIGGARSERAIAMISGLGANDRLAPLAALVARPEAARRTAARSRRRS
jgi:2-methylcitrate dehydratase PrpD